ncbi:glycosyltransferase family 4 protein [Vagococcus carniphilus]|uniref:glycosyltransferase family 4 protein n=1 Tax=Vagococcus carniphilus TaxID=218144 RepID=UPI00288F1DE2|nr:glycosyltransferase family 4 protein [Vagococcus carniphilus]MDT2848633.1 glycosyltransferase family 4 protein [Vagococcus carniphilus]
MLKINMFSSADKVKGQGVGSAYNELIKMLNKHFSTQFDIKINKYSASDISHYHTVDPLFYLSTFFKKKRGIKVGYVHFLPETLEGSISIFSPFQKIFDRYLISFYKRMDQLVVVNPSFIPKLEAAGIHTEKVTYIPNFVSSEVFFEAEEEDKERWRNDNQFSKDDLIVLGAGQIQQRKGLDDFISLAKNNPEIQFIWAGGFSFGKITDGYDRYKKVYDNPPSNLKFTGIIDRQELVKYYNMADVFLLPSYNELFPMCILEAFNSGTPVMLRDLELYHAIIEDDYIKTKDVKEMQEVLSSIFEKRDVLETYRRKSKKAAVYYSEENVAKIWFDYYTNSIKK